MKVFFFLILVYLFIRQSYASDEIHYDYNEFLENLKILESDIYDIYKKVKDVKDNNKYSSDGTYKDKYEENKNKMKEVIQLIRYHSFPKMEGLLDHISYLIETKTGLYYLFDNGKELEELSENIKFYYNVILLRFKEIAKKEKKEIPFNFKININTERAVIAELHRRIPSVPLRNLAYLKEYLEKIKKQEEKIKENEIMKEGKEENIKSEIKKIIDENKDDLKKIIETNRQTLFTQLKEKYSSLYKKYKNELLLDDLSNRQEAIKDFIEKVEKNAELKNLYNEREKLNKEISKIENDNNKYKEYIKLTNQDDILYDKIAELVSTIDFKYDKYINDLFIYTYYFLNIQTSQVYENVKYNINTALNGEDNQDLVYPNGIEEVLSDAEIEFSLSNNYMMGEIPFGYLYDPLTEKLVTDKKRINYEDDLKKFIADTEEAINRVNKELPNKAEELKKKDDLFLKSLTDYKAKLRTFNQYIHTFSYNLHDLNELLKKKKETEEHEKKYLEVSERVDKLKEFLAKLQFQLPYLYNYLLRIQNIKKHMNEYVDLMEKAKNSILETEERIRSEEKKLEDKSGQNSEINKNLNNYNELLMVEVARINKIQENLDKLKQKNFLYIPKDKLKKKLHPEPYFLVVIKKEIDKLKKKLPEFYEIIEEDEKEIPKLKEELKELFPNKYISQNRNEINSVAINQTTPTNSANSSRGRQSDSNIQGESETASATAQTTESSSSGSTTAPGAAVATGTAAPGAAVATGTAASGTASSKAAASGAGVNKELTDEQKINRENEIKKKISYLEKRIKNYKMIYKGLKFVFLCNKDILLNYSTMNKEILKTYVLDQEESKLKHLCNANILVNNVINNSQAIYSLYMRLNDDLFYLYKKLEHKELLLMLYLFDGQLMSGKQVENAKQITETNDKKEEQKLKTKELDGKQKDKKKKEEDEDEDGDGDGDGDEDEDEDEEDEDDNRKTRNVTKGNEEKEDSQIQKAQLRTKNPTQVYIKGTTEESNKFLSLDGDEILNKNFNIYDHDFMKKIIENPYYQKLLKKYSKDIKKIDKKNGKDQLMEEIEKYKLDANVLLNNINKYKLKLERLLFVNSEITKYKILATKNENEYEELAKIPNTLKIIQRKPPLKNFDFFLNKEIELENLRLINLLKITKTSVHNYKEIIALYKNESIPIQETNRITFRKQDNIISLRLFNILSLTNELKLKNIYLKKNKIILQSSILHYLINELIRLKTDQSYKGINNNKRLYDALDESLKMYSNVFSKKYYDKIKEDLKKSFPDVIPNTQNDATQITEEQQDNSTTINTVSDNQQAASSAQSDPTIQSIQGSVEYEDNIDYYNNDDDLYENEENNYNDEYIIENDKLNMTLKHSIFPVIHKFDMSPFNYTKGSFEKIKENVNKNIFNSLIPLDFKGFIKNYAKKIKETFNFNDKNMNTDEELIYGQTDEENNGANVFVYNKNGDSYYDLLSELFIYLNLNLKEQVRELKIDMYDLLLLNKKKRNMVLNIKEFELYYFQNKSSLNEYILLNPYKLLDSQKKKKMMQYYKYIATQIRIDKRMINDNIKYLEDLLTIYKKELEKVNDLVRKPNLEGLYKDILTKILILYNKNIEGIYNVMDNFKTFHSICQNEEDVINEKINKVLDARYIEIKLRNVNTKEAKPLPYSGNIQLNEQNSEYNNLIEKEVLESLKDEATEKQKLLKLLENSPLQNHLKKIPSDNITLSLLKTLNDNYEKHKCKNTICPNNAGCYRYSNGNEVCKCLLTYKKKDNECVKNDEATCKIDNGGCDVEATCAEEKSQITCTCKNNTIPYYDGIFCSYSNIIKYSFVVLISIIGFVLI